MQPVYDPDKVLNLRVTPEVRERLAALVGQVSAGAAKLSRHGLAVWCLERGLLEAELDPSAVLRAPSAPAGAPAAPAVVKPASGTAKPRKAPPASSDAPTEEALALLRARLTRARVASDGLLTYAELSRRTRVPRTTLHRFDTNQGTLKPPAFAALDRELTRIEGGS